MICPGFAEYAALYNAFSTLQLTNKKEEKKSADHSYAHQCEGHPWYMSVHPEPKQAYPKMSGY